MKKDFEKLLEQDSSWKDENGLIIPHREGYGYVINKTNNVRSYGGLDYLGYTGDILKYWGELKVFRRDITLYIADFTISLDVPFENSVVTIYTTENLNNFDGSLVYYLNDGKIQILLL